MFGGIILSYDCNGKENEVVCFYFPGFAPRSCASSWRRIIMAMSNCGKVAIVSDHFQGSLWDE